MKDAVNFIESELKQPHLLKELRESEKEKFNDFISAFQSFLNSDYLSFIENGQINQFQFAKTILGDKIPILDFIKSQALENEKVSKHIITILKVHYLYKYSGFELNSFDQYYFALNVFEALTVAEELIPVLSDNIVFISLKKFAKNQFQSVKDKIAFEKIHRKQSPLEGFIASLTPEFKNNFREIEFISVLINYLWEVKYIDKYGKWVEIFRRKTEILGLIYALWDLQFIKNCDAFVKNTFCNTFRLSLSQRYINQDSETNVSRDARQNFKVELQKLYFNELLPKRPIPIPL